MLWNSHLSHYLAFLIIKEWEKSNLVTYPQGIDIVKQQINLILSEELKKEQQLDKQVQIMLDQLEKTHSHNFERYKMYPLLKKKLAEKKGVIL